MKNLLQISHIPCECLSKDQWDYIPAEFSPDFARIMLLTRNGWCKTTGKLLLQCGWLSVRQLVLYHSLILVFKIKLQGKPIYFREHFSASFPYRTRLATSMGIRRGDHSQHEVTSSSFVPRTSASWNTLPVSIRNVKTLNQFKKGWKLGLRKMFLFNLYWPWVWPNILFICLCLLLYNIVILYVHLMPHPG